MSSLREGSSSIPKPVGRGKSREYTSIDSRVVRHRFTLVLGIKDHSCRLQSVQ